MKRASRGPEFRPRARPHFGPSSEGPSEHGSHSGARTKMKLKLSRGLGGRGLIQRVSEAGDKDQKPRVLNPRAPSLLRAHCFRSARAERRITRLPPSWNPGDGLDRNNLLERPRNNCHPLVISSFFETSSQTGGAAKANHKTIPVVGRERTRAGVAGPLDTSIHIAISFVCGLSIPFVADQIPHQKIHSKISFLDQD